MKTHRPARNTLIAAVAAILMAAGLTGCISNDNPSWVEPVSKKSFLDTRLSGYWALEQYKGAEAIGSDTDYMYFIGDGRGLYYWRARGKEHTEQLSYWSQPAVSGDSKSQVNIQYGYAQPVTANYWFTDSDNILWLQWNTADSGEAETYVYRRIDGAPW